MSRIHVDKGMITPFRTAVALLLLPLLNASALVTLSQPQLIEAALEGRMDVVQNAINVGYPVDTKDAEGRTLLMYASFNGHDKLVEALIKAGADVNVLDTGGTSSLMYAASSPSHKTVSLLLKNKAEVNTVDTGEGFNALMWAAAEGQLENVKLLLKNGANPSHIDADGDTAMTFAKQKGDNEIIQLLQAALTEAAQKAKLKSAKSSDQ